MKRQQEFFYDRNTNPQSVAKTSEITAKRSHRALKSIANRRGSQLNALDSTPAPDRQRSRIRLNAHAAQALHEREFFPDAMIMSKTTSTGVISVNEAYAKRELMQRLSISQKFWDKMLSEGLPYTSIGHAKWVTGQAVIEYLDRQSKLKDSNKPSA